MFSDIDFPWEAKGVNDAGEVEKALEQLRMFNGFQNHQKHHSILAELLFSDFIFG